MIVIEQNYINREPIYRIYSDSNFYLQKDDELYNEIMQQTDDLTGITETDISLESEGKDGEDSN